MAEDFTMKRVPKNVTDAINNARTPSELREAALNSMAEAGIIVRTRDDDFNFRINPDAVAGIGEPASAMSAGKPRLERTIRFHERLGRRNLVIHADTEEELNALEAQILGY